MSKEKFGLEDIVNKKSNGNFPQITEDYNFYRTYPDRVQKTKQNVFEIVYNVYIISP